MAEEAREIFFEHITIGNAVKGTAIDSLTAIEVPIVGPRGKKRS